ncbi:hypothetical protein [Terrimonas alba]|uniref:hypothetical protein n=1 Tax=Terrimonas alba TaxID=3349636 RepID=UPI0035F2AAFF
MKPSLFTALLTLLIIFSSCSKFAYDDVKAFGDELNTWAFYDGNRYYSGNIAMSAVLDTAMQANNTYTLAITGTERITGQLFTTALSLADLNFTVKSYQSGVNGSDHATAMYFSASAASRQSIYSSTNNDPGAVMTYRITHYDAVRDIVTISFSGNVHDELGNMVNISRGKITVHITRQ